MISWFGVSRCPGAVYPCRMEGPAVTVVPEPAEVVVLCFTPRAPVVQQDSTWRAAVFRRLYFGSVFVQCVYLVSGA